MDKHKHLKQKSLIVILLLLICSVLAIGFFHKKAVAPQEQVTESLPQATQNPAEQNVILLTQNGFEPMVMNVKKGGEVMFMNVSQKTGNVSSDPHPEHNSFPELNVGNIKNETSAYVIFKDIGTYTYHNHLNPTQKGTIIVSE